eukprot:2309690-Rhodomonas_salina.2
MLCPVLTWRMVLQASSTSSACPSWYAVLSAYGDATRCPGLTWRMLLWLRYAVPSTDKAYGAPAGPSTLDPRP